MNNNAILCDARCLEFHPNDEIIVLSNTTDFSHYTTVILVIIVYNIICLSFFTFYSFWLLVLSVVWALGIV
jgi:hypothetical protein